MTKNRKAGFAVCGAEGGCRFRAELIGVYYINKGYPDFRQITINYQNEEYAIVEPNSAYGLQEYDYIVLYADSIHMNDYY